jgi:hypothetical protein
VRRPKNWLGLGLDKVLFLAILLEKIKLHFHF